MLCTIMIKDNDQVKYTLGLHNNLAVITGLAALNKVVKIKFITFCSAHHKIARQYSQNLQKNPVSENQIRSGTAIFKFCILFLLAL